jgi:V8-like Glu-specific endopeptidase
LSAFAVEEDKRLVYGNDDRTEPYSITNSDLLNLIQADVALISSDYITQNGDGSYSLLAYGTFTSGDCTGGTDTLCTDEPFRNQVLLPFCSGFLVHSNVIVTAGHCLEGNSPSDIVVIFDWKQQSAGVSPSVTSIAEDNVYEPDSLDHMLTNTEDWGVIYLNRDVVGRTPLKYRTSGTPDVGTPLVLVGHPWGLPMKVAPNAEIKTYPSDSNTFSANTDSYAGNSGSMVVNADTWEVEGILVTGNADFKYDSVNGCCRSNVCSDSTGCSGSYEGVTKITVAKISDAFAVQPALMLVAVALAVLNAF